MLGIKKVQHLAVILICLGVWTYTHVQATMHRNTFQQEVLEFISQESCDADRP